MSANITTVLRTLSSPRPLSLLKLAMLPAVRLHFPTSLAVRCGFVTSACKQKPEGLAGDHGEGSTHPYCPLLFPSLVRDVKAEAPATPWTMKDVSVDWG